MESFLSRYRNLICLAAVLLAQLIGLAVQVKSEAEGMSVARTWTVAVVTPFQKLLVNSGRGVRNLWSGYFYLRGVRQENEELRRQIETMRLEQIRLQQDAQQARRLQTLLGFKEQFISQTVAAQVIGSSGSEHSRIFYIDKGIKHGIAADMAVIAPGGIVGKVLRAQSGSSQVLMINDQLSGVGAILEKQRLQGIVSGGPSGALFLKYIMKDENIQPGEQVITSGGDRIFPKGLPIGTVAHVSSKTDDLFLEIRIKPAANLNGVEEVLVVTKIVEREPTAEEAGGPIRAADILAQRLPGVQPTPTPTPVPGKPAVATPAQGAGQAPRPTAGPGGAALSGTPKPPVPGGTPRPRPRVTPAASQSPAAPVRSATPPTPPAEAPRP